MTEKLKNLIEDELESAFVHGRTEAESEYRDLLDKAKNEAYQRGCDDATKMIASDEQSIADKAYQRGLDDAWEAARKIIHMPEGKLLNIFTECYSAVCTALQVLLKYDASEAIEKLKAYEEKQDDKIEVGDEVAFHHDDGRPDTVVVVTYIGQDGFIDGMDGRGTQYAHKNPTKWTKTGRHFDIASILEEMKE